MRDNRDDSDGATGHAIRFLWFDGVSIAPLWVAGRVLPGDERWLRHVVALSDPLIEELKAWTEARDALVRGLGKPDEMSALDAQADDLVARLNADLQLRFTAEHLQ